nr:unnamed protein product [Spirometra erinaceieuropaei]
MRAIQWDDLRRQARTLENDLDSKLASFGKLGSAFGMTNYGYMQSPNQPVNDTSSEYNLLSCDIENLLERLAQHTSLLYQPSATKLGVFACVWRSFCRFHAR